MPNEPRSGYRTPFPAAVALRQPVWAVEAPEEALSILEHAEAIAMVEELRPYCTKWSVELLRPDIANEIGLVIGGPEAAAIWAVYRDAQRVLHFEDLSAGTSYTFGTMSAGLRFVRAVIEATVDAAEASMAAGTWWERLPRWLLEDGPLQPRM